MNYINKIYSSIDKINCIWNSYGFEILFIISVAFIILYGLYRYLTKSKGTWSTKQYFNYNLPSKNKFKKNISSGELKCRDVLEKMFNRPFKKDRPQFLNNVVTGGKYNLELDCVNLDMKLAVEYNGIQHYKYTPYFHKNNEHFLNQKYRDYMKRVLCKEAGITLIEVPYNIPIEEIENYLKKQLSQNGFYPN